MKRITKINVYHISGLFLKISLLFFVNLNNIIAQDLSFNSEQGAFPNTIYNSNDYKNNDENFSIAQDDRGVMYFGNFGGILEFNGVQWKTIYLTNQAKISSLYFSKSKIMYVGTRDEFGYLSPDKNGELIFKSLSTRLTSKIGQINVITEYENRIYFISNERIFILNNNKISSISLGVATNSIFVTQTKIILNGLDNSLILIDLKTLKLIKKISFDLKDVIGVSEVSLDKSLIFTQNSGIYILESNKITKFNCQASTVLATETVSSIANFDNNTIAVWTNKSGLLFVNKLGNINAKIPSQNGLESSRSNLIFKDKDSNLWIAINKGIIFININSPFSEFTNSNYNLGSVNKIIRFKKKLFIATTNGLFYLDTGKFIAVQGIELGCWDLLTVDGKLVVASSKGVFVINDLPAIAIQVSKEYSFCLAQDSLDPHVVYIGTRTGLDKITLTKSTTAYNFLIKYNTNIVNIVPDTHNIIWMETLSEGVYRYDPVKKASIHYQYDAKNALARVGNQLSKSAFGIILYNAKGVFQFDDTSAQFRPSTFLNPNSATRQNTNWFGLIEEDVKNNYWVTKGDNKGLSYFQKKGEFFEKDTAGFQPISEITIQALLPDSNNVIWLGGPIGLLRFDLNHKQKDQLSFFAFIHSITNGDSLLFDDFSLANRVLNKLSPTTKNVFNAQITDIKFDFSANSYTYTNRLLFQFYLSGFDKNWLPWTNQSFKEYSNLSPGEYTFHVRAKNVYGTISKEDSFNFIVETPIYFRWWAWLFYIITGIFLITLLVRSRISKAQKLRKQLEELVKERTEEIVEQKLELEQQSEELAAKNDQLEKIDLIVQSINAEVASSNLFQTILSKFSVIRNMDNGSFLVYDKSTSFFVFKAFHGIQDLSSLESVELTLDQAKARYLSNAKEVYEDIFYKNDFRSNSNDYQNINLITPKSLLTIVIKNESNIEAFILLENISRTNAFDNRDISMVRNLKEHLIAAYIKTRLLENLESTLSDLKNTQGELIRQEKLASVGQLTKGIVDRILNPLNYVNNFAQLSDNLIADLIDILEKQKAVLPPEVMDDLLDEASVLKTNLSKIQTHSNSTNRILKDMQKLLKEKSRQFLETDLNSFLDSKTRSALQENATRYQEIKINLVLNLENKVIRTNILPYEFGQVIQNMVSNSCYTLYEKCKQLPGFQPEIKIVTQLNNENVIVRFRDNGKGIPDREVEKLFSPFFTTKPTSDGTGLGLFMVKDIIETHKGTIEISTKEGEFTEIIMTIPIIN